MINARAVLLILLIPALSGTWLHAQDERGAHIDIDFLTADDEDESTQFWREGDTGPFVWALPQSVKLRYTDNSRSDATGRPIVRELLLLCDQALIWFSPGDEDAAAGDPLEALAGGARNVQLYGEGHVWIKYSAGSNAIESITVRADRVFLDFKRSRVVTYDDDGNAKGTREELDLSGVLDNARIHSSADEGPRADGTTAPGIGFGDEDDTPSDIDPVETTGPAPSEDAIPEPAGTPKSLPQERGQRLFARAEQLRILSTRSDLQEIDLKNGSISSSSLSVAAYSIAADFVTIRLTPVRGTVYMTRPSLRILDTSILTLPVEDYAYDIDSHPPIRQLTLLTSQRFGFGFRSYIDAVASYDFIADPEPPFNPLHLGPQIDYYTLRGLGLGVNMDWGNTRAFGRFGRSSFRSIYIDDPGDDRDRARELGWYPVEKHSRGRIRAAYSQGFGDGWQFDHFLNYSSDANFRREFYESEYDNNDPVDSYFQLTRRFENLNFFLRFEPKVHPWQSKTEYLPTLGFNAQKVPVGDFGLMFSTHTEASVMRFLPGDGDDRESIATIRADSTTWLSLPFEVGPFALDPYGGLRFTAATSHIEFPEDGSRPGLSTDGTFPGLRAGDEERVGYLYRFLPFFGVNLQTFMTGTFPEVRIPGLGIDGLRHVFAPFVRYRNTIYNSLDDVDGRGFIPLDRADTLDEFHEIRVGFRNRLQTRTGWGENRRTLDYFEVMAELPIYPQRRRDNAGDLLGDLEAAAIWRPAPGFAIAGNMFVDPLTGNFNRAAASFNFDILNLGRIGIYYRLLKEQHQLVGVQGTLAVSDTYTIGFKQEYDMQSGEFRDTQIEVSRTILEALALTFQFRHDPVDGDFGFQLRVGLAFQSPRGGASLLR